MHDGQNRALTKLKIRPDTPGCFVSKIRYAVDLPLKHSRSPVIECVKIKIKDGGVSEG